MFQYKGSLNWLTGRTIYLTRFGSHAYGLNTPTSDLDLRGVAVPPAEYFFGFSHRFEQADSGFEDDCCIYGVQKFFRLASQCNPSTFEMLWTDVSDRLIVHPLGQRLLDNRDEFLSKQVRYTFAGYAKSQLKRMQTHYRWLKNPPKCKPERSDFGLPDTTLIPREHLLAAEDLIKKKLSEWDGWDYDGVDPAAVIRLQLQFERILTEMKISQDDLWRMAGASVGLDDNLLTVMGKERAYRSKINEWKQYQNWKATRNPAKAVLEEKYGYNSKNGMHLVRLLRMCREILTTGEVVVKRPDWPELLAIRNGSWSYEKMLEWAEAEDAAMDDLAKASPLPQRSNLKNLDRLCHNLVYDALSIELQG